MAITADAVRSHMWRAVVDRGKHLEVHQDGKQVRVVCKKSMKPIQGQTWESSADTRLREAAYGITTWKGTYLATPVEDEFGYCVALIVTGRKQEPVLPKEKIDA